MPERLLNLWAFRELPEALLAQAKLQDAGLWCELADDNMVRMDWYISNLVGGVKLVVREEDAEAAIGILQQAIPALLEVPGQKTFSQPICQRCGSLDVGYENFRRGASLFSLWALGLPVKLPFNKWKCAACGFEWSDASESSDSQSLDQDRAAGSPSGAADARDQDRRVYIATGNPGKLREFVHASVPYNIDALPLPGIADIPEPAETGATFAENARIKAIAYSRAATGKLVLADDSGLSVDALNGSPGVYSARYAQIADGKKPSDRKNNRKLLEELERLGDAPRDAEFICAIAVALDGEVLANFEGRVRGEILRAPAGGGGFGYDPLFFFPPLNKTFAEIDAGEKLEHSHRGAAFRRFLEWYSARLEAPPAS